MQAIFAAVPDAAHLKTVRGASPLHHAAQAAQCDAVKLLLQAAPALAVHPCDDDGTLPLHLVAVAKDAEEEAVREIMRLLLEAAPGTATTGDHDGETGLHWAAASGHAAAVKALLLAAPEAAHARSRDQALPLHLATKGEGNATEADVEETVQLEAAPETALAVDCDGQTALHWAASAGRAADVRLLLTAAPTAALMADFNGMLPIHVGAAEGNAAAVEVLLAARPELTMAVDGNGLTAAHHAASNSNKGAAVLQLLIAAAPEGSCHAAQDSNGWCPAHVAALNNCPAALRYLLSSAPAAPRALAFAEDDWTPLHLAVAEGSVAAAEVLLEVAPEACLMRNSAGWTPLSVAAWNGQEGMVALLLAAAPQAVQLGDYDSEGLPIHGAAEQGHAACVAQLLAPYPDSATAIMHVEEGSLTPLGAAMLCEESDKRAAVAHVLLPAGPAGLALQSLLDSGPAGHGLLPNFVAARLPLSEDLWAQLPMPCPGLGRLLPAVLAMGTEQAQHLVRHLPAADAERLRLAALCLARAQQRTRVHLPPSITGLILSLFDA